MFRLLARGEKNPRAATALGQRGRRRLAGDPGDVASNFLPRGEKRTRGRRRLAGDPRAKRRKSTIDDGNRPSTTDLSATARWRPDRYVPGGTGLTA
ncbi:hypothetical protein BHE74_00008468 [Ensete ventricosum]|nr:hypothetical protein GW17_00034359 [Ensete ventricosum]RWW83048.1 hypothetical protein BHE74_00008468 [Ensete ventricosum]RZR90379.1 hypothetical protein BHM03_00018270 [Ensete ventricosum]